jgi:hypothetical protein
LQLGHGGDVSVEVRQRGLHGRCVYGLDRVWFAGFSPAALEATYSLQAVQNRRLRESRRA